MATSTRKSALTFIYGPVPSRRLGYSLGIDILPPKTCTLDCIYCQLGRTLQKTLQRKTFFSPEEVVTQVKKMIASGRRIDHITFSGSGEPTLNASLGRLIREINEITEIPVAVLTNATLLTFKEVRKALLAADVVAPSLDAATEEVFKKVNRPHPSLKVKDIIQGLKTFRAEFKGSLWLEIMLVKGVNDSPSQIQSLKKAIAGLKPDRVQLNTVVRPPAEKFARPLRQEELEKIKNMLGGEVEIIAEFHREQQAPRELDLKGAILATVRRRPVTLSDLAASWGKSRDEVKRHLNSLLKEGIIRCVRHKGTRYYEPAPGRKAVGRGNTKCALS